MDYINRNGISNKWGDNPQLEEVEICKQWLIEFVTKRKTINNKFSSYGLKHKVEKWAYNTGKGISYVSNGAFIKAALDLGYSYQRIRNGPNAFFNMSFPHTRSDKYKLGFPTK